MSDPAEIIKSTVRKIPLNPKLKEIGFQAFLLAAGSFLCAFAVNAILVPNEFLARGITGITLLIYYKFSVMPVSVLYLLINVPIFLIGWKFVGRRFVLYSLGGLLIYTLMLGFVKVSVPINDKMLAAVMAGILMGIGVAVILRSYGSAGGAEILYVIFNKTVSITLGMGSMIVNGIILLVMAFIFPLENVLYTLIFLLVSTYTINAVFHGMTRRRSALIISENWKEIARVLTCNCGIRVTILEGRGAYKGAPKTILYSVISKRKLHLFKRTVLAIDPKAFITIMSAEDVAGVEIGNQPHW
ncbi:MAG TPA: YitT family protein [bacterium]|nr:YitT family protein [bacterium]